MQEQVSKKPLVDILSEQLNKRIVMRGDDYVELGTDYVVSQENLDVAIAEQSSIYDKEVQDKIDTEAKQAKLDSLAVLTVTTANGNTFDADDVARADMLSAIIASDTLGNTEQQWKMADNSWVLITLGELKEASALAIQAKGAILSS